MRSSLHRICFSVILGACLLLPLGISSAASAGTLTRIDMRFETEVITLPVHIEVNAYKWENDLEGTSGADFDGGTLTNVVCDAVVCITDVSLQGSDLVIITYSVNGYKGDGTFDNDSRFEVIVGGQATNMTGRINDPAKVHTACDRPIWRERWYPGTVFGSFYVVDLEGPCLVNEGECPVGTKLYKLEGAFTVPCGVPAEMTFNLYKDTAELKASATATYDGDTLTNSVPDLKASIVGATQSGPMLIVNFETYGQKDGDDFDANTTFELVVNGCGTYRLESLNTSCTDIVDLFQPYPLTPSGQLEFLGGCGQCLEGTVVVRPGTWGEIKATYH